MRYFLFFSYVAILLVISCDSPNDPIVVKLKPQAPIKIDFGQTESYLSESDGNFDITLEFSRATLSAGTITILVNEISGIYDLDYSTRPEKSGNTIVLDFPAGSTLLSFSFSPLVDTDEDIEKIDFEISAFSGENMALGTSIIYSITIEDEPTVNSKYAACLTPLSAQTLDVVTWNIEFFPLNSSTLGLTKDIVENMDADIIAIQEIDDVSTFNSLVAQLDGWSGAYYDVNLGIELGYLFKDSEISSFGSLSVIYSNDRNAFPREPVLVTAKHITGLEVTLINLHLKCCNEGEVRRGNASVLLKDYIDTNLPDDKVIVLGDLNDDILSGSPFTNFIQDSDNYLFTDIDIAEGVAQIGATLAGLAILIIYL